MRKPPEYGGIVTLDVSIEPVSLQASRAKKDVFLKAVRSATDSLAFLFSGDVEVRIEWALSEQSRYHTASSPDVDNILKVILDGLSGPTGILINDVQVQSVHCYWVDIVKGVSPVSIWIRPLNPDLWIEKAELVFVRVTDQLCFPVNATNSELARKKTAMVVHMAREFRKFLETTGDYFAAKGVLPAQMLFHQNRLDGFRIVDPTELGVNERTVEGIV